LARLQSQLAASNQEAADAKADAHALRCQAGSLKDQLTQASLQKGLDAQVRLLLPFCLLFMRDEGIAAYVN